MADGPGQLYGDFHRPAFDVIIQRELDALPPADLPSEAILNAMVVFLRSLFSYLPSGSPFRYVGKIVGEPDPVQSRIVILQADSVKEEVVEKRPAILVTLGPRKFVGTGLDQLRHVHTATGTRTLTDLIQGVMVISVVTREGRDARRLSDWIGLSVASLKEYLRLAKFHEIHPQLEWSGVHPAGDLVQGSGEHVYVTDQIRINYQWTWNCRVSIKDPTVLNGILIELVSSLDEPDGAGGIVTESVTSLIYESEEG